MLARKFPKTKHVAWSGGIEQITLNKVGDISGILDKPIVITHKMDGENTSMYSDKIHARSIDSGSHPSRSYVKQLHANIKHNIPEGMIIHGENLYASHYYHYDNLKDYFLVFGISYNDTMLSWREVESIAAELGLHTVDLLWEGIWYHRKPRDIHEELVVYTNPFSEENINLINDYTEIPSQKLTVPYKEGYVIRNAESFPMSRYEYNVFKYRVKALPKDIKHWMHQPIVKNNLITK